MRRLILLALALALCASPCLAAGPELLFLAATKGAGGGGGVYDITTFEGTNPQSGDPDWYGWHASITGATYLIANPTGGQALAVDGDGAGNSASILRQLYAINGTISIDAMDNGAYGSVLALSIRDSVTNSGVFSQTITLSTTMTTYNIPVTGLTAGKTYNIFIASDYFNWDGCIVDNIKIPGSTTPP